MNKLSPFAKSEFGSVGGLESPRTFVSPSDRTTASLLKKPTKESSSELNLENHEPTADFGSFN